MPETADVGDGGSVFAPASGAHKRLRIEEIHGALKKHHPARKRICLGGGRVSGRSRENLITGLIPRVDLVQQRPVALTPLNAESDAPVERHLPPSFRRPGATVLGHTGTVTSDTPSVEVLRRYSEIHAEREARVVAFRTAHPPIFFDPYIPQVSAAPSQQPEVTAPTQGAPPFTAQEVVARPLVVLPATMNEVAAPPPSTAQEVVPPPSSAAQEVAPVPPTSQALATTQSVSSMLQSFAFEDTRDGYDNDPNSLF